MAAYTNNTERAVADPPTIPRPGGARLGYRELFEAGFLSTPQEETFDPECAQAYPGPFNILEVVPDEVIDPTEIPPISLLRQQDATEAYAILPSREPIRLDHHGQGWGVVRFGMVYPRIGPGRFRCPTRFDDQRHVAIKILNKRVVHNALEQGGDIGKDNPYKEVARMRELQDHDGNFVLTCIDFLEDEEYLYIVTPKGDRTLKDVIRWQNPNYTIPAQQAILYFHRILRIVDYLHSHGIVHHDLSPDNLLLMPGGNLVVFDLAKSIRMPINPTTGHRGLLYHESGFGTRAWMSPEAFRHLPYDGSGLDIWAASLVFYNLLTNFFLYRSPENIDHRFRLFVLAGALQDVDANELTREIFHNLRVELRGSQEGQRLFRTISRMADANLQLAPELLDFLGALLNVSPAERPTMAQIMENGVFGGLG